MVDVELPSLLPFIAIRQESQHLVSVLVADEEPHVGEGRAACKCLVVRVKDSASEG